MVRLILLKIIEVDGVDNIASNISVIIRTKNEERWIGHCIQSLLDNYNQPELIIIDDNSKDETINIVKSFEKDTNLDGKDPRYTKIIFEDIKNYSPGLSLNKGVSIATKDIILIISAHCVLFEINLERTNQYLDKYAAVYGNQIPVYNGKRINKRYVWSNFSSNSAENFYCDQEQRYFLHNAFAFYKKETLQKFPFDNKLTTKEDRYWANDIINNKKLNIFYDSEQSVYHHYTINGATWKGLA